MDNAGYVGLSRQAGLLRELNTIANNIANISTNGFRREGVLFSEHVASLEARDEYLSLTTANRQFIDLNAGEIKRTGNPLDVSIQGDGFFLVETPLGQRLTRDGAFSLNAEGELVTSGGARVLDESGGAIVLPPNAEQINITDDGVINVDKNPVGRIGVVTADLSSLVNEGGNLFKSEAEFTPAQDARVLQYSLEGSNVSPVIELARLIEVQRTYEMTKSLSDNENDRIEQTIRTLSQSR